MINRYLKNRALHTLIWTGAAMLLLSWQHFQLNMDWLGIATLATLITAAIHGVSLAWLQGRIETSGGLLASLYGHDDKA